MKTKALTPLGSLHPILFFVFVYVVTLVIAIFICSSLFYSCNSESVKSSLAEKKGFSAKAVLAKTNMAE